MKYLLLILYLTLPLVWPSRPIQLGLGFVIWYTYLKASILFEEAFSAIESAEDGIMERRRILGMNSRIQMMWLFRTKIRPKWKVQFLNRIEEKGLQIWLSPWVWKFVTEIS